MVSDTALFFSRRAGWDNLSRGTLNQACPLEEGLHTDVSAFYSSIREGITGSNTLTVRKWLSTQSYEAQRQFGLKAIDNIRRGIWKVR